MRISIRRCLSMLRNTRDGNELALPAINALQGHIVGCWYYKETVPGRLGY